MIGQSGRYVFFGANHDVRDWEAAAALRSFVAYASHACRRCRRTDPARLNAGRT